MNTDTTNNTEMDKVTDSEDNEGEGSMTLEIENFVFGQKVKEMKKGEYIETIGRRKTSTAQVRITPGAKKTTIKVNGKDSGEYFPTPELRRLIESPYTKIKYPEQFEITVIVNGGGMTGQAEAIRHGISRALVEYDADTRGPLKKSGFLKRDPRKKERKKPGLKKARKAPQWSKR